MTLYQVKQWMGCIRICIKTKAYISMEPDTDLLPTLSKLLLMFPK